MRLYIFCPYISSGRGGLEKNGTNLANALANQDIEVLLGFDARRFETPLFDIDKAVELRPWKQPFSQLGPELSQTNPDVFFVFNGGWRLLEFGFAAEKSNSVFAFQEATNPRRLVLDNWSVLRKISFARAAWEREIVAAGAVRIRQTMQTYARSYPACLRSQVRFFPNAVRPASDSEATPVQPSRKKIINVGGLKKVKNAIPLIEAFSELAPDFPEWDLDIFGGGFASEKVYQSQVREKAANSAVRDRIRFRGEVPDLYPHFEESNIHVIGSLDEGRPTCVAEAMAHGIPSVGFAECPGTNELIRNEENGVLVSSCDSSPELAQVLRSLMGSLEYRNRLGNEARSDAEEFRPERVLKYWLRFFQEAASYGEDDWRERLFAEQQEIDSERARSYRRLRNSVWSQLCS